MNKLFVFILLSILVIYPIRSSAYSMDIVYLDINGNNVNISQYSGKLLLLDGMATWCKPCELQMEYLQDVYESVYPEDVAILSLSLDPISDNLVKVAEFKEEFNADWDFGLDNEENFINVHNITGYPTTFLFNSSGHLIKKWLGLTESNVLLDEIEKYVDLKFRVGRFIAQHELLNALVTSPAFLLTLNIISIIIVINLIKSFWLKKDKTKESLE
ncbi:MAG: TlpA family protein disulfide reductase [Candidatus Heimdallarchaeota archaeon]|nr:TlpA family protein disulfide reductase [Candidatus Heimdallarchaeota archaeon]MDH5646426.1 TlpA family protein disulfide reductase [Candidatus Heimdallarchaeota archaeon]